MTSMPASRRARAITLAPRSCPSSPGLATRTRIFSATIVGIRTQLELGRIPGAGSRPSDGSGRLYVQAPPQIPAGNAAVRLPALGNFLHLGGGGKLDLSLLPCTGWLGSVL